MDLLDTFRAHLPHLADKAAQAANEICDLEMLLEEANEAGLPHVMAGWKSLHETFVTVEEPLAARWLAHLKRYGYETRAASCNSQGAITAHLQRGAGRRLALTFNGKRAAT